MTLKNIVKLNIGLLRLIEHSIGYSESGGSDCRMMWKWL